jgi:hypothetical protein
MAARFVNFSFPWHVFRFRHVSPWQGYPSSICGVSSRHTTLHIEHIRRLTGYLLYQYDKVLTLLLKASPCFFYSL